ncbi:MAG: hypothetical protein AAGE65_01115 [Planctomycetota bacterium]
MTRTPPRAKRKAGVRLRHAAFAVAWVCGSLAVADQITLDGIAVPGIEIVGIRDGHLVYLVAGAERMSPLEEVTNLRIDAHPTYTQAVNFLEAGQARDAAGMLRNVLRNANRNEGWLRQYASWRLVQAIDAQGAGEETAAAFAALVSIGPDPFFLADPPTRSLAGLEGDGLDRARAVLERAQRNAGDEARAALQAMIAVLDGEAPAAANEPDAVNTDPTVTPGRHAESAVALPATLASSDDPAVDLLRRGRFADAVTMVDSQLRNDPGRLQQRTFVRAVAMLKLAEASGDRDAYLDAGLEFMRVVVMSRAGGAYLGPALLETAVVHRAVGADEIADALFEQASSLIDEQDEPDYFNRYAELTGN